MREPGKMSTAGVRLPRVARGLRAEARQLRLGRDGRHGVRAHDEEARLDGVPAGRPLGDDGAR